MGSKTKNIKIYQVLETFNNNKIDVVMLSETNRKWTSRTTEKMSSNVNRLGRKIMCYYADGKPHETTESEWLQMLMMNVITGKTCPV